VLFVFPKRNDWKECQNLYCAALPARVLKTSRIANILKIKNGELLDYGIPSSNPFGCKKPSHSIDIAGVTGPSAPSIIQNTHMKHLSPLRYPGGKASLAGFLTDVIDLNELRGCHYFEPFAGGAGAALALLVEGVVAEISINDADIRIFSFWKAVLEDSHRFIDKVFSVPLTLDEWHNQRDVCGDPAIHDSFDVGFAAFYMNRCNRSGVLTGAGPIGGLHQSGKWTLGVRFSREPLAKRVIELSKFRDRIHLSCSDSIDFLKNALPFGKARRNVFVYLDPPYVNKGQRLYLNAYKHRDHVGIARYLNGQKTLPWLLSYDDDTLIRELYQDRHVFNLPIRYSLQKKRSASELIICSDRLMMPRSSRISGKDAVIPQSEICV
jgi:DNA adenine methylase